MVGLYDIGRDKELHPSLLKINSFNVDTAFTTENDTFLKFLVEELHMPEFDNEHMYLFANDIYDYSLGIFLLGIGDFKGINVSKRTIAEALLLSGARRFILVHNHPDNALALSGTDIGFAFEVQKIAELLEIEFLGSGVITKDGFITNDMEQPIYFDETED